MSVWEYEKISELVPEKFQLNLNEGGTNLVKIFLDKYEQKRLGVKDGKTQKVHLKLETMNPNRSFKDRSLAFQISHHHSKGVGKMIISSSGNAGISAAAYCSLTEIHLAVFVSSKVNPAKLEKLNKFATKSPNITINFSKRPKSDAIKYTKSGDYVNLRGSTDEMAIPGFKTIGYELAEELREIDAVFVPCSSGTSTIGIAKGIKEKIDRLPAINICQSTKIHPIAKNFDVLYTPTETSIADAISDRVAKREDEVVSLIEQSDGFGWILSDQDLQNCVEFLKEKTKLPNLTPNGVLSFAGFIKALKRKKIYKNPVCIISGI